MEAASIAELLAESKALVQESDEGRPQGESIVTRYWTVEQEHLDDCIAYLKAMPPIVNPMTGTRWARTGTWYGGRVYNKPGNLNPLVASGANGLIWLLFQEIQQGSKTVDRTESENSCRYKAWQDLHLNVRTVSTLPAAGDGYTYKRDLNVNPQTGAYNETMETRRRLYQHQAEFVAGNTVVDKDLVERHLGLKAGNKDDDGEVVTLPDMDTVVQGVLYEQERTKNEDCTEDVTIKKKPSKAAILSARTVDGALSQTDGHIYLNSRTKLEAEADVQGTVYHAGNTINPDGTYNGQKAAETSKPVEIYVTWPTRNGIGALWRYENWRSIPTTTINGLSYWDNNSVGAGINTDGTYGIEVRKHPGDGGVVMGGVFQFDFSEHTTDEKQVGYDSSKQKWITQKWKRHEQYFRNKSSALTFINGVTFERTNVHLQNLQGYGAWWMAIYYVRDGVETESTHSNGT